ncbi:MAG: hypothetical protein P1P84_03230 [Deferrisomatales bacterium]|nr:hypothetical protein [Deferrisomatales bacterium]
MQEGFRCPSRPAPAAATRLHLLKAVPVCLLLAATAMDAHASPLVEERTHPASRYQGRVAAEDSKPRSGTELPVSGFTGTREIPLDPEGKHPFSAENSWSVETGADSRYRFDTCAVTAEPEPTKRNTMQEQRLEPPAEQRLRQRIVVLPLQPAAGEPFDGTGLALHFLLGNVLALHTGLEEFWFGWRAQKIFVEPQELRDYCRGTVPSLDLPRIAREQDVRFWIAGEVKEGAELVVRLQLTDAAEPPQQWVTEFSVVPGDGLVALRRAFLDWLADCGLPMPREQAAKALWTEETDPEGLRRLGEALEVFYGNGYAADPRGIDPAPFDKAVAAGPESYLALDLLGWARYRRQEHAAARKAFSAALEKNPHGAGVLSGLMHCAVEVGDEETALRWAEAIANLRGADADVQKASAAHLLAKKARSRGDPCAAAALYRKATAWNPTRKVYADGLAAAVEACGAATGRE